MSSDLELASSPRPVFFRLPAPAFLTGSPEGGPMLASMSMQSRQPPAVGLAQLLGTRIIIDVGHARIDNKP
jgi:hypothetical protein